MHKTYEDIYNYVKQLEIIDTHEHLPHKENERNKENDIISEYLIHYFKCDLISAGLDENELNNIIESKEPIMDKWKKIEWYWNVSRHTGYGRALDISVKELYDIPEINRNTIEELNEAFKNSFNENHYQKVLKEKSKIKIGLLDSNIDCDRKFFRSVYRLDNFVFPQNYTQITEIENMTGIRICSFDDWLEACESTLNKVLAKGVVALKSGLAYLRSLKYNRSTRSEAEKDFNEFIENKHISKWENTIPFLGLKCQDYMMHFIMNLANKRKLTFQIHTGLQEGNGNIITNSNPSLLTNLFLEYPDIKFDIFHIGYPYYQEISALAKNFQNVFIDMCWAHIVSPTASVNALVEWLDLIPCNKISAFGGDYCFIDGVYGHQYLARMNVSKALAIKVNDGVFDIERAKEIAKMLFYDNPVSIFNLDL